MESQFGKMITMEGADIYFDSPGKSRGMKTYDKNGVYNAIAALNSDDVTTLIGCKANSGHVAPRVVARVEIAGLNSWAFACFVAPRVGARVEMHGWMAELPSILSPLE